MTPAWGRCPMGCPQVPGWLVPFTPGDRFPDGVAARLGQHPSPYGPAGLPCIGSGQPAPPMPVNPGPTAAYALGLQREALSDGALF